jgi:protein-L-isoaspartate(D-aspartate) O-methyltransferase
LLSDLPLARRDFADAVIRTSKLVSPGLKRALNTVSRERFFEEGPWHTWRALEAYPYWGYQVTADADPRWLYQDAGVRLIADQELNSGRPSAVARMIDALDIGLGASVFQVGCGNGYFTALLAEIVGPQGRVLAVEVNPRLAAFAKAALAGYANVTVIAGDVAAIDPGPVDGILTHVGVTRIPPLWAERLRVGGGMIVTLSATFAGAGVNTPGVTLLVRHETLGFSVSTLGFPVIYPCSALRTDAEDKALRRLLESGLDGPAALRLDRHAADSDCWMHGEGWCLSRTPLAVAAGETLAEAAL